MPLPDASRLLALPDETWRALGARLRAIGLTAENAQPIVGVAARHVPAAAAPMRAWRARRARAPWADAMRMLMLSDPLSEDEARAVLGDVPIAPLESAGVLVRTERGLVSPFVWNVVRALYVICDDLRHRGDAVMGSSATTHALCDAATGGGRRREGTHALDVGCGAGTVALLLAGEHDEVIGTDVSARAVTLARANARLNGIANATFRQGDLFAPVAGERFDVVVSQPPFVSRPEGFEAAPYLYGGEVGDELALRLLRELPERLAPGGRAYVLVEWPDRGPGARSPRHDRGEERAEARVRAALADDAISALLVEAPPSELEEHCIGYSILAHPELGDAYAREVTRRRDHLEANGVTGLRLTLNVLAWMERGAGFTWTAPVESFAEARPTPARIEAALAAHALVSAGPQAILAARVRVPPGTTFAPEADGDGVVARPPRGALASPLRIARPTHRLLTMLDGADSVGALVAQIALATDEPLESTSDRLVPTVATALRCGLLEVASAA